MLHLGNILRKLSVQRSLMSFYAVARGHRIGIYDSWEQCEKQVKGFKGAKYKKFPSRGEASKFIKSFVADFDNVDNEKLYWPKDADADTEELPISDAELIAAAAMIEDADESLLKKVSNKRKADTEPPVTSKVAKYVSKVWEPVGHKIIGDFKFEVDIEGYVIVYTDGSCINNGQSEASAGLGVYFGDDHPLNAAKPVKGRITNNVGEIQAAIHAIKVAKENGIEKLCLSTDSQFLIKSITMWIHSWKKNNWRLKDGTPVKNVVDFKELDELLADKTLKVKWNYVKGHKGIKGNLIADRLAREGSDLHKRILKNPWMKS